MAKKRDGTMSERQFAKHTGKALSTIQDARRSGRLSEALSRDVKGRIRIDPIKAAEELAANTQPRVTDGEHGGTVTAWRAARARREAALAALAEDELRVSRGALVDAKEMETAIVDVFTHSRTKLLGIPTKLKQRCPHISVTDIEAIDGLIREALEDLASGIENGGRL